MTDKTRITIGIFNKCAVLYQEKYMDVGLYHDSFDLFCQLLRPDAAVLELACGPGNITSYLLDKRPDLKIFGIDLAENMIDLAKVNNPNAAFDVMDCRRISEIGKKYDAVMCGFCLPYLSKEETVKLIKDALGLLLPNGILYISTMEDDYSKSGFKKGSTGDEIYMHYHEADYLVAALQENGFKIIDLTRQDYPEKDGSKTIDLIIIAQK
jgi:2-polyprenyl-3-methyl-5-hydroxy-6-metoxy-1,4-benzoquinol methylase